jgi:branched-chain amino acid transport system ATP-binding protein
MLKVEHAFLSFEGLKAVNNVSIEVETGSVTALIGPNGAGKTTLFNLIAGVYKPESGHIYLDGEEITGLRTFQICGKGIARTYQVIKLFGGMTVLENVLVGMHSQLKSGFWQGVFRTKKCREEEKRANEKAHQLLQLMGLDELAKYPAASLAYGQQRRLEIARALASDPKLLLLDEPAAGMNSTEKFQLNERIREIVKMGVTVLIVEHDMNMVMSIADKIYVINSGMNLAEGNSEEIANNPDVIEAYLGRGDV